MKERLDVMLVKRNLAESREKAKAVIMAGNVFVDGQREDKAGSTFAPDVNIEVQQSDSTTGVTSALEGVVDIGMASRDLKDSELEQGVTGTVIAMDGIAVVVNNENPIDDLSSAAVKSIYTGEVTDWADVQ